jgi:hypothetical protein
VDTIVVVLQSCDGTIPSEYEGEAQYTDKATGQPKTLWGEVVTPFRVFRHRKAVFSSACSLHATQQCWHEWETLAEHAPEAREMVVVSQPVFTNFGEAQLTTHPQFVILSNERHRFQPRSLV